MTRLQWIISALIIGGLLLFACWFDANYNADPIPQPQIEYQQQ